MYTNGKKYYTLLWFLLNNAGMIADVNTTALSMHIIEHSKPVTLRCSFHLGLLPTHVGYNSSRGLRQISIELGLTL